MTEIQSGKAQAEKNRSRGIKLLQRGAALEAAEQFRRVVKAFPDSAADRVLLAQALWKTGRRGDAEAELRLASALSPNDPDIHAQLGRLAAQSGRRVEAAVQFEKAIALDPRHPINAEWLTLRGQISQSVHSWHLPMLADQVRNDAFQAAIEAAVSADDVVLDIGTGTGLLAMMAARAGARQVVACEALPDLAELARLVVHANGYGDKIVVIAKQSTDLALGSDLPERASLLVSETFDALLIGEGVIEWFAHAREHLLTPGAKIIPAGGTIRAQLVSLPRLKRMHPLESVSGFDLRPFAKRALEKQFYPVRLEAEAWAPLSDPFDMIEFDFRAPIPPRQAWSLPVKATADGTVDALLLWFDLQLDETTRLTSGPGERRSSHWNTVVFLFDTSRSVAAGAILQLKARMGSNVFYFEDIQAWNPPSLPAPKRSLVIGLPAIPSNLHALINVLQATRYIHSFVLRPLTRSDAQGTTTSLLCKETPSLDNGRVRIIDRPDASQGMEVTFTLRPDLRWGDGSRLTTQDIVFSALVEGSFHNTPHLADVVAIDDQTYKVILDAPRWDFDRLGHAPINARIEEPILAAAASPLDYAVASAYNRAPDTPGLWNGPYLPSRFRPNEAMALIRNPFWDGEAPGFEQVTLRCVTDTPSLQSELVAGEIDLAYGLTSDQAIDLRQRHGAEFDVELRVGFHTVFLYLQTEQPPFDDKRVRQAVMLGIDRGAIVAGLFDGMLPVAASYLPPGDPNYNRDLAPWPYDPGRARALLIAAGYRPGPDGIMQTAAGERLTVELTASAGNHSRELLIEVIRGQLRLIGIDVRTETLALVTVSEHLLAKRAFTGMVLNGSSDVSERLYETFSSQGIPSEGNGYEGYNYTGYHNPLVDAALKEVLVASDPASRRSILTSLQSIIMDDLPLIPLYHGSDVLCSPKWMTGLIPARSASYSSSWAEHWRPRH